MAKKKRVKAKSTKEDSFAPIVKELALAYERINGSAVHRLRWLLAFSELDLDSLSEGRFADLRWELVVFGLNRKPEQMKSESDIVFDLTSLTSPTSSVDLDSIKTKGVEAYREYVREQQAERGRGAQPELVREFQATVRRAFDDLLNLGWWEVTRPSTVERIALDLKSPEGHYHAQNPPAFTGHDILLMQAIDLIKAERQRLKTCRNPRCKKRFVATKKGRAFFHSPTCSAYVRIARSRGKQI